MADTGKQRRVGYRVGIRERIGQVVTALGGKFLDLDHLVLAGGIELDFSGVPAVAYHHARGDHVGDAERLADRADHFVTGAGDQHHVATSGAVLGDQGRRFGVHIRVYQLIEGFPHDLLDLLDAPALTQLGQVIAGARHALFVAAAHSQEQLRIGALDYIAAGDQPVAVERSAECQRTGLGDDRLVEVEERGTAAHGRKCSRCDLV